MGRRKASSSASEAEEEAEPSDRSDNSSADEELQAKGKRPAKRARQGAETRGAKPALNGRQALAQLMAQRRLAQQNQTPNSDGTTVAAPPSAQASASTAFKVGPSAPYPSGPCVAP
jgi:hypothetical protein